MTFDQPVCEAKNPCFFLERIYSGSTTLSTIYLARAADIGHRCRACSFTLEKLELTNALKKT